MVGYRLPERQVGARGLERIAGDRVRKGVTVPLLKMKQNYNRLRQKRMAASVR